MTQKSSQVLLQVEGMVAPARAETVARVLEGRAGVLAVPVARRDVLGANWRVRENNVVPAYPGAVPRCSQGTLMQTPVQSTPR